MPERFPAISDDITFELLLLHSVAERGQTLRGSRAATLRASSLWGSPALPRRRRSGLTKGLLHAASALMIASSLSLTPPASLPALAQRQELRLTIVDAQSSKPLANVVLRDAQGNAIARTGNDGKMAFTPPNGEQRFTLERTGYQSVTISRAQLGGSNLISMRKAGAPATTASPQAVATPKPVATPTAKPVATPKPAATPTAKPVATPKPAATPTAKPVATPKPVAKPTAKPVAQPTATAAPARKPAAQATPQQSPAHQAVPQPQVTPAPQTPPAATHKYVVKRGDTLWGIAGRTMGDPVLWQALYAANRTVIARPRLIYPGQTLLIPAAPATRQRGKHVVKRGDSLWEIAEEAYGDPLRWKDIYQANRNIIKRPSLIHPGQILTLPR